MVEKLKKIKEFDEIYWGKIKHVQDKYLEHEKGKHIFSGLLKGCYYFKYKKLLKYFYMRNQTLIDFIVEDFYDKNKNNEEFMKKIVCFDIMYAPKRIYSGLLSIRYIPSYMDNPSIKLLSSTHDIDIESSIHFVAHMNKGDILNEDKDYISKLFEDYVVELYHSQLVKVREKIRFEFTFTNEDGLRVDDVDKKFFAYDMAIKEKYGYLSLDDISDFSKVIK